MGGGDDCCHRCARVVRRVVGRKALFVHFSELLQPWLEETLARFGTQTAIENSITKNIGLIYRKFMFAPCGPVIYFHRNFQ